MDDLKFYGKNEKQVDTLVNTVLIFSKDNGTEAPSFLTYLDKTNLANDIGGFFVRKIKNMLSNIDAVANFHPGMVVPEDPEVGPVIELCSF